MKANRIWIISTAALVVALFAVGAIAQKALLKGRPTAIAVVDLQKVLSTLQEKVQMDAERKSREEAVMKENEDREKEIKSMKSELDLLNASSPGYRKKAEDLAKKAFDLQSWRQWQNLTVNQENRLKFTQLYTKIVGSAGKLAKDNGYDLVLFRENSIDFSAVDPKELGTAMYSRKVLWAADDLDITEQLITAMNNEFKNTAAPK